MVTYGSRLALFGDGLGGVYEHGLTAKAVVEAAIGEELWLADVSDAGDENWGVSAQMSRLWPDSVYSHEVCG